jgi:hypothetical protein
MLYYKWWIRKGPLKNKPKVWKYKEVRRIANERYVELMQAFAEYVSTLSFLPVYG